MSRKPCASCYDVVNVSDLVATCDSCGGEICFLCKVQTYDDATGDPAGAICKRCADALVAGGYTEPAQKPAGAP